MKDMILQKLSEASLEQILDRNDFQNIDWIWINREVYRDIFLNLQLDKILGEKGLEKILRQISDDEMIKTLKPSFKRSGYLPINQYQFAAIEKGFRPTTDIETVIFIKEKIHRKYFIRLMNRYAWILKAMAMDTYFKMGVDYKSLRETYKDLYEDNNRIIESIISDGEYTYLTGQWKFTEKADTLYFYKSGKIYHGWTEGEANAKFQEFIHR